MPAGMGCRQAHCSRPNRVPKHTRLFARIGAVFSNLSMLYPRPKAGEATILPAPGQPITNPIGLWLPRPKARQHFYKRTKENLMPECKHEPECWPQRLLLIHHWGPDWKWCGECQALTTFSWGRPDARWDEALSTSSPTWAGRATWSLKQLSPFCWRGSMKRPWPTYWGTRSTAFSLCGK